MIGRNPKTKVAPSSVSGNRAKEYQFLKRDVVVNSWGGISRQTLGEESGKNLGQEKEPMPSSQS